ncbi:double-strand break repair helicase AddA [Mesorhizobium sp. CAU 1741]|uniref:double-strand break repair helicase AddA n=1 Tax=Mesorhizobium sp. CAU 1741 TaxID=3140366 RepID=UPI00325B1900
MSPRPVIPDDTRQAQARAATPGISAWVSANAGSGKTHVLASRVIRMLLQGVDPSRILCLTYTRAAAANMANRVFDNLSRWTMLPRDELASEIAELEGRQPSAKQLGEARQLFARALETPGGLKIQTIHAFCEAVLHQFPLEANIAGHFELLDTQMEAALVAEARREMIARAAAGESARLAEAFATVLDIGGESGLDTLLAAIVGQRDALKRFIAQIVDGDGDFSALDEEFGFSPDDTPSALAGAIWPDRYFDRQLAVSIASRAAAAGKATAEKFAAELAETCAQDDATDRLSALRSIFLTRKPGGIWSAKSTKTIMAKGVGEHFPEFPVEFERFASEIEAACDRVALSIMLEGTRAALTVAEWLIARYERLKSARGFLDFNDLITRTATLLAREDAGAWVQYKLDKGIDHILLDEAQDTSPAQWAVVRALAAEFFVGLGARDGVARTVFAVGDEKQSIYSFQGAEPESFALSGRAFRDSVLAAQGNFEHVRLTRSFRSTYDVLSAVDRVFAREENRAGLTRDPEPIEHLAVRESAPGHVEVWPSLSPTIVEEPDDWTQSVDHASAPAVRLAGQIAATIAHWLATGDQLPGRGRALVPGDIMILVRKRDRFIHALSRELKNREIPVAGADRLLLTGHIAVQDLMAIARVALQPDDDLSLAALLKSPVFGLDEDQLFDLAARRPAGRSLLRALETAPGLTDTCATLQEWRNEAGYASPFAFFAALLARDGLRRKFMARLGPEAGDVVDEFLNFCLAAEKTGATSLEAVLALLDGGGPEIKREMDQTRGEIRIMTTHASKGLEAPVVFLVDSGAAAFSDSHLPRLIPFDPPAGGWQGRGFLWRAAADMNNGFSRRLSEIEKAKAEQEYRRLLYVGMTRAEDRLIVCGYHGKRGQPDGGWHAMVSEALGTAPQSSTVTNKATGEEILRYAVTPPIAVEPESRDDKHEYVPGPPPPALFAVLPPAPPLPRPLSPSGAGAVIEPGPTADVSGRSPVLDAETTPSLALERGTAVHRLLQILPSLEPAARDDAALRYLERVGRRWPAGESQRVWESVRQVLDHPQFAAIFAPGSRAEVSLMGTTLVAGRERAVSGTIDRLVVTPDAVLVVDYKTNRPPPRDLSEVPYGHVAQLALYRALLAPLYAGRKVRAALVYTERPALIPVSAEVMDDALARLGSA